MKIRDKGERPKRKLNMKPDKSKGKTNKKRAKDMINPFTIS